MVRFSWLSKDRNPYHKTRLSLLFDSSVRQYFDSVIVDNDSSGPLLTPVGPFTSSTQRYGGSPSSSTSTLGL